MILKRRISQPLFKVVPTNIKIRLRIIGGEKSVALLSSDVPACLRRIHKVESGVPQERRMPPFSMPSVAQLNHL